MAYGKLFLVRHGKSSWNHLGLWTGHTDVDLVAEGIKEARRAGDALKGEEIHCAYVSQLKRAQQTLAEITEVLGLGELAIKKHHALNERHYGEHTGKNKWEVRERVGEEEFKKIRRSWDHPIPGGETLKDVHARAVPYFEEHIRADLSNGRNVLVVAHGNSLRAIVKHLEGIDEARICEYELGTGEVHCYHFADDGRYHGKEVRAANSVQV